MKVLLALICVLVVAGSAAAEEPASYVNPTVGFRITPPMAKLTGQTPVTLATFFLPVRDAFTPNVNVQAQPFREKFAKYMETSREQFKQHGLTVLKAQQVQLKGRPGVIFEYTGKVRDRELHWYAVAFQKNGDQIILITATALHSHWDDVKKELVSSVNSFRFDEPAGK